MRESLESNFRDAPFTTRERLEEAIRLDQANHYMRAAEQYDALLRGGLTSQQQKLPHSPGRRPTSRPRVA